MKIQFGISDPVLYLFSIVTICLLLAYFIYFYKKDKDEFSSSQRNVLSFIRLLYLLLLSVLILSPLLEIVKKRLEKPILVIGTDNSKSMAIDSANISLIHSIADGFSRESGSKFDLQFLNFGEKVAQNISPLFTDKISNYSEFIDEVEKRYYNLNVGAIVLIGDGIYNEGKNPAQLTNQLTYPVYTIGIGDTMAISDQAIMDVTHNQHVFQGNTFPVEIEATYTNFNYPTSQLQIYVEDKLAYSEIVNVPQPDYYFAKTINLKAEKKGLQNVTVVLTPFQNEQNTMNNRFRFSIEVHDNKYQVLFLTQGPHPDIGALRFTLDKQANFNIAVADPKQFVDYSKYDLIVLNQLPSLSLQQDDNLKKITASEVPLLIVIGPNTSISALDNMDIHFSMDPSTTTQESFPFFNDSYPMFSFPASIKEVSTVFPPLLTYFTKYNVGSEYSVIAYQKINGIEMNYPLIATGMINNRKIGIINGEGIWRWRMAEYQNFDNHDAFDQLTVNLFNYLCLKEVREQFNVVYKHITPETSPVRFKAQVYNEIYEPVTNTEVKMVITDSINSELSYLFDPDQTNYNLNIGYLAPGKYNFTASTTIGDKDFSKSGNFMVQEINIEQQNQKADFKILNSLAEKTGGKFFTAKNWQDIFPILDQNQNITIKSHKEKNIHEITDWKVYLLIIILLLSLEWFLRKYWGSY